jgi:serine/threonine protein kinase
MSKKMNNPKPRTITYRGKTYSDCSPLTLDKKVYFEINDNSIDRRRYKNVVKVFDPSTKMMRAVRFRERGAFSEMRNLTLAARANRNVPEVIAFGRSELGDFLVTPWIEGECTLEVYLRRAKENGRKPHFIVDDSYRMILGLIKGLLRLHRIGLAHGDLHPENLLVGHGNRLMMIDFGSAWNAERARRKSKSEKPGYTAPEQWRQESLVDHRADQFSVTVIFYRMLTGKIPYGGIGGQADPAHPPPYESPGSLNRQVWPALDRVITRGLSLVKENRFDTSEEWLREFEAAGDKGPWHEIVDKARMGIDEISYLLRQARRKVFGEKADPDR